MTGRVEGDEAFSIAVFAETENSGASDVAAALAVEIAHRFGPPDGKPISIVARSRDAVVGGPKGGSHWGWLYIRHLWVRADWRRRGLGRHLLDAIEAEARARGCAGLYVDTFDPAAAAFYRRAGYVQFGKIDGFPPGHERMFLSKHLGPCGE